MRNLYQTTSLPHSREVHLAPERLDRIQEPQEL